MSDIKTNSTHLITTQNGKFIKASSGKLLRRKFLRLPTEYQEVEWVQMGNNTQFIQLPYVPSQDTRLQGKFMPIELREGAVTFGFYGSRTPSGGYFGYCNQINSSGGCPVIWWKNSLIKPVTGSVWGDVNKLFEIDHNKQYISVSIDGQKMLDNYDCGAATFSTDLNLCIGIANANGAYLCYNKCNVYETIVWDDQTLVHHLIPCYRISDNIIGMYDLISNKFRTNNSSSNPFTVCGPSIII